MKLQYECKLRSCPRYEINPVDKHLEICIELSKILGLPFECQNKKFRKPSFRTGYNDIIDLPFSNHLKMLLRAEYINRCEESVNPVPGSPWHESPVDECLRMQFVSLFMGEKSPSWYVDELISKLISTWDAYRVDGFPEMLMKYDRGIPEAKRARSSQFHRTLVYRIDPISYYDCRICQSAFNLTPDEVCKRVQNEVPSARVIPVRERTGVLIRAIDTWVDVDDAVSICDRATAAIRGVSLSQLS